MFRKLKLDLLLWKIFPGLMAWWWGRQIKEKNYSIGFNCAVPESESSIAYAVIFKLKAVGLQVIPLHERAAEVIRREGFWRDKLGEGVDLVVLTECRVWIPMPDETGMTLGVPSCRFRFTAFQADNGSQIHVDDVEVDLGYDTAKPGRSYGKSGWAFYSKQPNDISASQSDRLSREAYEQILRALYIAVCYPNSKAGWLYDTSDWPYAESPSTLVSC